MSNNYKVVLQYGRRPKAWMVMWYAVGACVMSMFVGVELAFKDWFWTGVSLLCAIMFILFSYLEFRTATWHVLQVKIPVEKADGEQGNEP